MPRKTKDIENKEISKKKSAAKKETKKKSSTTKKASTKKTTTKTTTKAVSTKKTPKATTKKSTTTKRTKKVNQANPELKAQVEYYDLPYRYNQTIVKVLAQTPTHLFIYWDISDEDRENYKRKYGDNFFESTKPVLKIYNDTMHYDFEVDINDFANSWYLEVNDSKCDYRVELARRPIYNSADIGGTDYVYISSSNEIEAPNDRILFNTNEKMVYFRNVKTNKTLTKSFANLSFMRNMGKIYNIYDLYNKIYKNENIDDLYNPSSKFF